MYMYKIAEERFQELYRQYTCKSDNTHDYSHYLQSVQENGLTLFDVPRIYLTNEVIMTALETPNNPIKLLSRMDLERCVDRQLNNLARYYHNPITKKDRNVFFTDLARIINYRYNKSFCQNFDFLKQKLYTFIDFFSVVSHCYNGMDTICYVYLYRGISIPVHVIINNTKKNYKLLYDTQNRELHLIEISNVEYQQLWDELSVKLTSYFGNSSYLTEYCWKEQQDDDNIIPILQDGEYYETFKTIEEDGVVYDYSHKHIISVPDGIVDITIPEEISSISEYCFKGNKSLKKVKLSSAIKSIPKAAFMDCVSLEEVDLSLIETSDYSKIVVDSAAFCNCKSLKNIDFSKLKLHDNAQLTFAFCNSIESIKELEMSGASNSKMNFFHCVNLKELVKQSYPHYGEFDFAYCTGLKKASIPRSAIKFGLFCGCENLEDLSIYENCNFTLAFEDYCFAGCKSLKYIDTLNGGAGIGNYSFLDCTSLNKIVISKKDEFFTKISPTAFIGCPNFLIEWSDGSRYPSEETIEDYWLRKGVEVDKKKRIEKLIGEKFKTKLIHVYETIINKNIENKRITIGELFKKDGKNVGKNVLYILNYDLCSWDEYLKIGRVFYESIPFSTMDDDSAIRMAIVYWAKTCTIKAYLKAPVYKKFDAIQQVYDILKISHGCFIEGKIVNGEKACDYAKNDVLNTYFDYSEIEKKATNGQLAFIESYTSLSDIRMSYLMRIHLLKHLSSYNKIIDNEKWYYDYANKEIEKLSNHAFSFGDIDSEFLQVICYHTWRQFIEDDVENKYEELGQDELIFETNTAYSISFADGIICWETERITDSRPYGVNPLIPDADGCSYNSSCENGYNGYGRYAGSYAQDEMGYSDDDIDTIFDGDPLAYWNID